MSDSNAGRDASSGARPVFLHRKLNYFSDSLELAPSFLFLLVLTLSSLDGLATIHLVANGATELNPVLHFYLGLGPVLFLISKSTLTLAGLFFFLIYRDHRFFGVLQGSDILKASLVLYIGVLIYHAFLIAG